MTDPNLTLLAFLLDRSGSMAMIKPDMERAFNSMIGEQRSLEDAGRVNVTLAQFDDVYEFVYSNVPIADVGPLVLEPRYSTALYDAFAQFITDIGTSLSALPEDERPGNVIVTVITDGLENASVVHLRPDVLRVMVKHQEDVYSWRFVFLGANMNAIATAGVMGIKRDSALTYNASSAGVAAATASTSDLYMRSRVAFAAGASPDDVSWSDADRSAALAE